jgi:hypothetical protein
MKELNRFEEEHENKTENVMVFNAALNNISVRSWRSVLLMEETGENY